MGKKTALFLLALMAVMVLTSFTYDASSGTLRNVTVDIQEKTVSGHKYVIATSAYREGCGVSMVHSEACPCKKKR